MSDKGSGDAADLAREEQRTIRYESEHPRLCSAACCVTRDEY